MPRTWRSALPLSTAALFENRLLTVITHDRCGSESVPSALWEGSHNPKTHQTTPAGPLLLSPLSGLPPRFGPYFIPPTFAVSPTWISGVR